MPRMDEKDNKGRVTPAAKPRRTARWILLALLSLFAALALLVAAAPFLLPLVPLPELEFDLSPHIKGKLAEITSSKSATAKLDVSRGRNGRLRIAADGKILDWPYTASADVRFGFLRVDADASFSLTRTNWRLYASFSAESATKWSFSATMPEHKISNEDPILSAVVPGLAGAAVSNLVFTGSVSLDAEGSCTKKRPVPAWSAHVSLKQVDASCTVHGGHSVSVDNLRMRLGISAIADHKDISPLYPRADSISGAGLVLSNVYAHVRATESSYLVTEAGADCCGGELRLYSLFLDPKKLSAGATVFADGVNAGEALSHVSGFHGRATGRLHGKFPFFLRNSRELRMRNAYLFSTPGETGKVRIYDSRPILDNLALGGVPEDVRSNLSKALADLDYNVLKVQLTRGDDGESDALTIKLEGSATHGKTTVPVNLDVTFRGDLDQIINTGLKLRR